MAIFIGFESYYIFHNLLSVFLIEKAITQC
jgi:hypothetical protein